MKIVVFILHCLFFLSFVFAAHQSLCFACFIRSTFVVVRGVFRKRCIFDVKKSKVERVDMYMIRPKQYLYAVVREEGQSKGAYLPGIYNHKKAIELYPDFFK